MSERTQLTPYQADLAGTMLKVVNHEQYVNDLEDPAARQAIGGIVLGFARKGDALDEAAIDHSIELFGQRHGLKQAEFDSLVRKSLELSIIDDITTPMGVSELSSLEMAVANKKITELSAADAADTLRVVHVALEVGKYIHADSADMETAITATSRSRTKVRQATQLMAFVRRAEAINKEQLDADAVLELADNFSQYSAALAIERAEETGKFIAPVGNTVTHLLNATDLQVKSFLADRYNVTEPTVTAKNEE